MNECCRHEKQSHIRRSSQHNTGSGVTITYDEECEVYRDLVLPGWKNHMNIINKIGEKSSNGPVALISDHNRFNEQTTQLLPSSHSWGRQNLRLKVLHYKLAILWRRKMLTPKECSAQPTATHQDAPYYPKYQEEKHRIAFIELTPAPIL